MKKINNMSDNFNYFIKKDWSAYSGKWVAIAGKKVISSSKSLNKVIKESDKKCKGIKPTFTKIPEKNTAMIL